MIDFKRYDCNFSVFSNFNKYYSFRHVLSQFANYSILDDYVLQNHYSQLMYRVRMVTVLRQIASCRHIQSQRAKGTSLRSGKGIAYVRCLCRLRMR